MGSGVEAKVVRVSGEPLGLLHQQSWTRKQRSGKKKERKKSTIALSVGQEAYCVLALRHCR